MPPKKAPTQSTMPTSYSECSHQSTTDSTIDSTLKETGRRDPSEDHDLDELFSMFSNVDKVSSPMKSVSHVRIASDLPLPVRYSRRHRSSSVGIRSSSAESPEAIVNAQ